MAINKKLIHFKNKTNFNNEVANDNILDTSIVFVQDSKEIHTHGTTYKSVNWSVLEDPFINQKKLSEAGDVVLYNRLTSKKAIVKQSALNTNDYPADVFIPIGVVVIPASHDVYGTGECGIMSLTNMDCDNPELGASWSKSVRWGGNGTDLFELPNLDRVPLISTALTSNEIIGVQKSYAYIPSTKFTSNKPSAGSGLDTLAGYDSTYTGGAIPSPYLEDGSRNPSYYSTDTSINTMLSANCLSDFDGVRNTAVITAAATAQADWKTSSTITSSGDPGYYPAACCCYRFNPDGNSAGKWYLPAIGELGYMIARFTEIQNGLTKVQSIYGSSFAYLLSSSANYWSSSEYSSNVARDVYTGNGGVFEPYKSMNRQVRAFVRA